MEGRTDVEVPHRAGAVAIYETVFLGLGVWLGPTAWAIIHHYAPGPSDLVLMLVTIIGWVFAGRALIKALRDSTRGLRKRISGATSTVTPAKVPSLVQLWPLN